MKRVLFSGILSTFLAVSLMSSSEAVSIDPNLMTMPTRQPGTISQVPLSAVFDESLVNSPRAASIRAQLGITKAAYAQAFTLPNPSFFFLTDTAQKARQVGGALPIEPPWKLAFRLIAVKQQLKQTDLEIQRNLWQLRSTIRRAFLDVVIARETFESLSELQSLSQNLLQVTKKRFTADDVAALDTDRAELAYLQADADTRQSNHRLEQAKERLSVLMGRDYRKTIDVPRLPPFQLKAETHELLPNFDEQIPSLDALLTDALKNRLEIKLSQQTIALNKANMRVARGNIIPNPLINAGSSYSGNPPDGPPTRGFFLGVTQELPVFNFQQGELSRLRAQNIQLSRELESNKNLVTEDVVSAYQQLASARERVEIFQKNILPTAEKVARLARRGYEVGQSDITATLSAQQAYIQTKTAYLDAVRQYQQALTDTEQAIGHPF